MRFLTLFLISCLVTVFAAPTTSTPEAKPTAYNHGDIVGVRADKIEEKDPTVNNYKKIAIHPAVVVAGPDAEGKYKVATVSKKHLHDPPQADASSFHPGADLEGKIKLVAASKAVGAGDMKPWKSEKTGVTMEPLSPNNLAKLKDAMKPHVDWTAPHQPPAASSSKAPAQSARRAGNRAIPGQAHAGGSTKHVSGPHTRPHSPAGKKAQHVNVHAGGSKRPATGSSRHPAHVAHPKPIVKKAPHPNAHVAAPRRGSGSGSAIRGTSKTRVAKTNNKVKKPVINQSGSRGRKGPGVKRSLRSW